MTLPIQPNTTCDVYRSSNAPPSAPDVAGVKVYLQPVGQSSLTNTYFSHVAYFDKGVDVRDNMVFPASPPQTGPSCDTIYVPDKNGTPFRVLLVRRYNRGGSLDHKRAILVRGMPNWPTNDL